MPLRPPLTALKLCSALPSLLTLAISVFRHKVFDQALVLERLLFLGPPFQLALTQPPHMPGV